MGDKGEGGPGKKYQKMGKVIYRQPLGHNVNNQESFFCTEGQKDYKIIFFLLLV